MSVVTAHQTDLTTFCKFKREHKLRRALHLLLNRFVDERRVLLAAPYNNNAPEAAKLRENFDALALKQANILAI